MAIYHFHLNRGKAGKGKNHCDYINREGRYGSAKMKEELVYKEAGNLPSWAKSASEFFDYADVFERSNGNVYTEFDAALPAELSLEENIKLVKDLVSEYVGENKVYAFAIHEKMATLDQNQRQPHVHLMFSERIIADKKNIKYYDLFFNRYNPKNPELGGYQKDNRFSQNKHISAENVNQVREFWETTVNKAYQRNGFDIKVSCKSLEQQRLDAITAKDESLANELDRPAQIHLGPKLAGQMKRALQRADFNIEMLSPKGQVVHLARQLKYINQKIKEHEQYIKEFSSEISTQMDALSDSNTNLESEGFDIAGNLLSKKILGITNRLSHRLSENRAKIEESKHYILSDEGIYQISLSIFTNGASKKLNKQKRLLDKQKEAYAKEAEVFSEMKTPGFWDVSGKKIYAETKLKLENWEDEIKDAEKRYFQTKNAFEYELSKEENQKGLAKVIEVIEFKRTSAEKFVEELTSENDKIKKLMNELISLNSKIDKSWKYHIETETANSFNTKNLDSLKAVIKSMKKNFIASEALNKKSKKLFELSSKKNKEYDAENDIGI